MCLVSPDNAAAAHSPEMGPKVRMLHLPKHHRDVLPAERSVLYPSQKGAWTMGSTGLRGAAKPPGSE